MGRRGARLRGRGMLNRGIVNPYPFGQYNGLGLPARGAGAPSRGVVPAWPAGGVKLPAPPEMQAAALAAGGSVSIGGSQVTIGPSQTTVNVGGSSSGGVEMTLNMPPGPNLTAILQALLGAAAPASGGGGGCGCG